MKTASVADLRNHFPKIAAWIGAGEEVLVTRRGKALARLVPESPCPGAGEAIPERPDFAARRKRTWRGRVFSMDEVHALRDAELEGGPEDPSRYGR